MDRRVGPRGGTHPRGALGSRTLLWTSLGISALLHLLALLLYPLLRGTPSDGLAPPPPATAGEVDGMRVLRIVEVETPGPRDPAEPEELEEEPAPELEPTAPDLGEPEGPPALVRPGRTRAERLRPHLSDRRIWTPFEPERHEPTPEQRAELELAGLLEAYNDSVAAAEAAAAAARDWTVRDGQGRRWGISPGQLHLGDITLPLPDLEWAGGDREQTAQRIWEWEDIQHQASQAGVRDSWKERAQAIRARRDAQRRAEQPDTSRSR